jgi:MSHA biogenesis protein MshI
MQFFKKRKRTGWAALKTSGDGICFAHVMHKIGSKPVVSDWVCQALDLKNEDELSDFAGSHALNARRCVALLDRSEYQMLQVDAVNVPAAEVRQAVRWGLKDLLDYPVANATVDVLKIPADKANPARKQFMYAIAARTEVIRGRIVKFIERTPAGLEAIDVPELGQRNIAAFLEQPGRGLAMLSFNSDGGLLTFTGDGELYHARQIDVTVEQLQAPDEDRRMHVYERVALDLQRSLDNFERQFPYVGVNRLLLAPFPMRAGFHDYLKSYLYLQVETFELSDVFDLAAVPELSDAAAQARAFIPLGAALREEAA